MKKLLPPKLFFLSILLMVALKFTIPQLELFGYPYSLVGIVFLAIGLGFAIAGSRQFQRVGTNIKTFDEPDRFVRDGLFSFSRNPMYLGFVSALLGIAILLGHLPAFAVVFAFFIITDRWYIAFEERVMRSKFGVEYEQYRNSTRRWI